LCNSRDLDGVSVQQGSVQRTNVSSFEQNQRARNAFTKNSRNKNPDVHDPRNFKTRTRFPSLSNSSTSGSSDTHDVPGWLIPDFKRHNFLSAAPPDATRFSKLEIKKKNEDGAKQLFDWVQDIYDVAEIRGVTDERRVFAMARRLLRGEIKEQFLSRYSGPESIAGLQNFVLREISPRDPIDYYRRKLWALIRKPGQNVESFGKKFLTVKKAYEMALGVEKLADETALSAYCSALKGAVGKNLEQLWMKSPPSSLDEAMREAERMEDILFGDGNMNQAVTLTAASHRATPNDQNSRFVEHGFAEAEEMRRLTLEIHQLRHDYTRKCQDLENRLYKASQDLKTLRVRNVQEANSLVRYGHNDFSDPSRFPDPLCRVCYGPHWFYQCHRVCSWCLAENSHSEEQCRRKRTHLKQMK